MNISLPKALEEYVREKVSSGQYASASEVVRESLREARKREEEQAELRHGIRRSLDELDAGDCVEGDTFEKQLRERHRERFGQ